MRSRLLFVCLLLPISLSGCENSEFAASENSATRAQEKNASSNPPDNTKAAATTSETTSESELVAEAIPPVPVAGAYLNCSYQEAAPAEVRCEALDDNGQAKDFIAKRAYIISGDGPQWTEVAFNSVGVGQWVVQKRADLKPSFAVALVNDQNAVLADWIVDANQMPPLKLSDPSFEDLKIDTSNDAAIDRTQFLYPNDQKSWKARLGADSNCAEPILELGSNRLPHTNPAFTSSHGEQWVELDSTCTVPTSAAGGNIALYQDLTLSAGRIYEVSFDFKAKPNVTSLQKISVKFGDEVILIKDVTEGDWTTYKFVRPVSSNAIRIEFEEIGTDDSRGAFLDNVRIYDVGVLPQ